jgi:hypothetical protein
MTQTLTKQIETLGSYAPLSYAIKRRGGETLYQITGVTPREALCLALVHVKLQYVKAKVLPAMFDCDPAFYCEPCEYR